jgi:heme exporter protein A
VFEDVSFAIDSGEALIVTGPNGAGKSTLLRVLAGFLRPAGGRITLEGGSDQMSLAEQAHYVGHHDAVKPALTLAETLRFWAAMLGGPAAAASAALEAVELGHLSDLPAGTLSAGQRRRLALARLVAIPRPIWLLDEPTTAIDAASEERLLALLRGHLAGGGLVVAATHAPLSLAQARTLRLGAAA